MSRVNSEPAARPRISACFGASDPLLGCPSCGKLNIISGSAGGVPERLKGADCKSVGLAPTLVRIQPPPPLERAPRRRRKLGELLIAAGGAYNEGGSFPGFWRRVDFLHRRHGSIFPF